MSKKVERMKNPVKSGTVSVRHVWSMDGEKMSLSQAADYCDATYSPMHYAWKMAVKDGRTRFVCKGVEFSTEPVEPRAVESKKDPWHDAAARPVYAQIGLTERGMGCIVTVSSEAGSPRPASSLAIQPER